MRWTEEERAEIPDYCGNDASEKNPFTEWDEMQGGVLYEV